MDESPEGLVEEDVILYPSLVAEFPGVTLDRDIAIAAPALLSLFVLDWTQWGFLLPGCISI